MLCGTLFAVRILVDYRPALRERTGVGEFVHELAKALSEQPGGDDRSPCSPVPGRIGRIRLLHPQMPSVTDRRRQGSGSRAGVVVEPDGMAAGRMVRRTMRRRAQPESVADSRAARRAGRDRSRPRFPSPSRTDERGDSPRLSGAGALARRARACGDRVVALCRRRSDARAAARSVARARLPAGTAGVGRRGAPPRARPTAAAASTSCSWAR